MPDLSKDALRLIGIMADGECHSGESLGQAIGVTRAAIWKRLQQLSEFGLVVESHKGRGYRLLSSFVPLSDSIIRDSMAADARELLGGLHCFSVLGSTNEYLLNEGYLPGEVCLAEWQSAGRGRRGRRWVSPFGANLYLSLRWHFDRGASVLEGLSLAVGVLIVEALEDLGVCGVALKWPNDLLFEGAKLGGILIEIGGDLTGECVAVVGIGVNVNMSAGASHAIDQPWTDLLSLGGVGDRNILAALLISKLLPALSRYHVDGFSEYRGRWLARAAFLGQPIRLMTPAGVREGVFRDVDDHGAFAFETSGGVEWISGGEISLRGG